MRESAPRWTRFALLCVLAAAALLLAEVSPAFALSVVPLIGLVAALIAGRFPGEKLINRLRERRAKRVKRRRPAGRLRIPSAGYVRPVGRLLAFALAMRPPPATAERAPAA